MAKAKQTKPRKHRYVVEVVVETDVKVTKKAVREAVQECFESGMYVDCAAWGEYIEASSARVRKVDLD